MSSRIFKTVLYLLLSVLLVSCSNGGILFPFSPTSQATPVPLATPIATLRPNPVPTAVQPGIIRVWVPPQFNPAAGTAVGDLLQARLDEFVAENPGLRIEVRVKAVTGPANLLDSLSVTSFAAPLALPDLIALPYHDMEAAALKGLIRPLDDLTAMRDDPDWFPYARQLSHIQNTTFGIPFAGDALLLLYRPSIVGALEPDWDQITSKRIVVALPAADTAATFTLSMYQSAGGTTVNDQGRATVDGSILLRVLEFFQATRDAGVIPFNMSQYATDAQAYQVYQEQRSQAVVTWSQRYLTAPPADTAALPLPGLGQERFSLAKGWVWAVASTDPRKQVLSVALAEFLTEAQFHAIMTEASGHIPARPSSLQRWQNPEHRELVNQIAGSAILIPPSDQTLILGPVLEEAVVNVLKDQATPQEAVQVVIDKLK